MAPAACAALCDHRCGAGPAGRRDRGASGSASCIRCWPSSPCAAAAGGTTSKWVPFAGIDDGYAPVDAPSGAVRVECGVPSSRSPKNSRHGCLRRQILTSNAHPIVRSAWRSRTWREASAPCAGTSLLSSIWARAPLSSSWWSYELDMPAPARFRYHRRVAECPRSGPGRHGTSAPAPIFWWRATSRAAAADIRRYT